VDEEWLLRPQRWDVRLIRRFMLSFGLLSSAFDLLTFLVLLHLPGLSAAGVRSGWFVESVLAATGTVLVIRSARPLGASRPSRPLLLASAAVMATALALPFCPWAAALGLAPLPAQTLGWMMAIVATCVLCTDLAKRAFYPRFPSQ
jgi:Mg2+-importing ATPase